MWDELGIAPCDDPKAIRRAYAARLKKLDPDRDPEAFARLRHAFEWALNRTGGNANWFEAAPPPARTAQNTDLRPPIPAPDHDDIRDRDLLVALDAALRRHDAAEAMALFYRAAATGALSLESDPDVIERTLAVVVDDLTLGSAAFRRLTQTVGISTLQIRAPVTSELHRRALARLRAEDWYDDLLIKAEQKRGRKARHQTRIARLLLGRVGRYWNRNVDISTLKSWLAQYKTHAAFLEDRIDPAWVKKVEGRLSRPEIFRLLLYGLFIGSMLIQSVLLFAAGFIEGDAQFWAIMVGAPLVVFFLWIFMLIVKRLLKLLVPGWAGFAAIAPFKRARILWAGRSRTIRNRSNAKNPQGRGGNVG